MKVLEPTPRTQLKRLPERARYDRDTLYQILDEGLVCHLAFAIDGQPFAIPTAYARVEDALYIHGSPASRMLRQLERGLPCCVTVTLVDALVLARSAFHHSMNFRSAVVLGTARKVRDAAEKRLALEAFVEHVVPGRSADARPPNDHELSFTKVLRLPIEEASAKVRTGPPIDDEADLAHPAWAGVIPLGLAAGAPQADPLLAPDAQAPDYAKGYVRPTFC
jgi:nitroimidazol reductase NimA-like FMN-containing flavoprotein (pyridoxamine 5'-phosphate oxidase superfamily)